MRVLREQGFVTLEPSPTDGREKIVILTRIATTYLDAQRKARSTIDGRLKAEVGEEAFEALYDLLVRLGGHDTARLRTYLQTRTARNLE